MNKDLTIGPPSKVLRQFCLPLFGSVVFQQLYNIADSLVAGKFIGENALAAVGNSYEITMIFIAFAFGCNMGCSVVVSQLFGAKKFRDMKTAVSTSWIFAGAVCAVLMLIGLIGCTPLLRLIRTPEEVFADSRLYLSIYVWGLPFVFFYNIANGIFTALGDSKTPFWFLAASSTANIGMDVIFVTLLHMGVAGVAWATFLCQGVSCILAIAFILFRLKKIEHGTGKAPLFSGILLKKILTIAIPSILQQNFVSIGNIVVQTEINSFGPAIMAGYSAAIKLNNLVVTSFLTIGNGISSFTAQNLGASKLDRIREGFSAGIRLVWALTVPILLLYMLGGRPLLSLFLNDQSSDAMTCGLLILHILSPFYFVVSAKLVCDGILRGSGLMKYFMTGTFTDLILRAALAVILSGTALGSLGIWCAWPIGWILSTLVSWHFYRKSYKA